MKRLQNPLYQEKGAFHILTHLRGLVKGCQAGSNRAFLTSACASSGSHGASAHPSVLRPVKIVQCYMIGARQHLRHEHAAFAASTEYTWFGAALYGTPVACPSPLQHDASKLIERIVQQLVLRAST